MQEVVRDKLGYLNPTTFILRSAAILLGWAVAAVVAVLAGDHRRGEECFEGVLRQVPESLEPRIVVSLAGDRQ